MESLRAAFSAFSRTACVWPAQRLQSSPAITNRDTRIPPRGCILQLSLFKLLSFDFGNGTGLHILPVFIIECVSIVDRTPK